MSPKKVREIHIQLMYTVSCNEIDMNESVSFLMSVFRLTKKKILEYIRQVNSIYENRELADSYLKSISKEYSFDRIAKMDLAIARVILHEVISDKMPIEIAVAESIRLSKKFSSYGSGKYLHAMIDSIYQKIKNERIGG